MNYTDMLTISMPVYERKDFFVEALESALNQTVKCKVIVVDNCSSHDYFEKVCREKKVAYYRNDRNIGMAANFARGFELSDTKFVMNLQDDDQLSPIYVESFLDALQKHPNIDIFFPDFVKLTRIGKIPHRHVLPFGYMKNGEKVIEYGIKYKLGFPYMASAIRRTKVNGFNDGYEGSGSYDWVWLYSEADQFSFYGDSRVLYLFRDHEMQDTKRNSIYYNLTTPYIYDVILKNKVTDNDLKQKAAKAAFWELVHLKSVADKKTINDFLKKDTVFSNYLREKLKKDKLTRILFSLPKSAVYLGYKSLKKSGAIH